VSAALTVEIYGYSLAQYGLIFACAGISILLGSLVNRLLLVRFDSVQLIGTGVLLMAIASGQLLLIAWLDSAAFAWLWSSVCLFMFTIPILVSNATVLALDPLPTIAGVASSIIGTLQNVFGALGAIGGAMIYNGSVRNSVITIAIAGLVTASVYVLKPLMLRRPIVHNPDELARD
jgi:DHA1 family bicyclomycin/chloramphenicol resistance-like MFS transporter